MRVSTFFVLIFDEYSIPNVDDFVEVEVIPSDSIGKCLKKGYKSVIYLSGAISRTSR